MKQETVYRCVVCQFETAYGNEINNHMIIQHTETRLITEYRPDRIYITIIRKTGEIKEDWTRGPKSKS